MGLGTDIRLMKLYLKFAPILEGEFGMTISWNVVLQVIATLLQILNGLGDLVPSKYVGLIAGLLGAVQTGVAAIAHFSNPDGTSAKTAYIPKGD